MDSREAESNEVLQLGSPDGPRIEEMAVELSVVREKVKYRSRGQSITKEALECADE